jgi:23S rRNA pseudouridine2457 synthase
MKELQKCGSFFIFPLGCKLDAVRLYSISRIASRGGEYTTPPCEVQIVEQPEDIFPSPRSFPPYLKSTWLLITLTEGRFRQVRKMVAAVRHRCMRLIRVSIEDMLLGNLKPGEVREATEHVFFEQLKLDKSPTEV